MSARVTGMRAGVVVRCDVLMHFLIIMALGLILYPGVFILTHFFSFVSATMKRRGELPATAALSLKKPRHDGSSDDESPILSNSHGTDHQTPSPRHRPTASVVAVKSHLWWPCVSIHNSLVSFLV